MDTAERDRRADQILAEALELEPEQREAILVRRCGNDDQLRYLVERLLRAVDPTDHGGFYDQRVLSFGGSDRAGPVAEVLAPGARIGAFEVVAELGQGGMARVYRAERREGGFEQTVAIKVMSGEVGGVLLARRFEQERQILASLAHPNIAKLLDGGNLSDGAPYVVLELVDGVPLDEAAAILPLEQRLRLMATVARAVQHAHRALVVHRDLKPSNILVTADGTVKLLDFGIAKVLSDGGLPDGSSQTATAVRLLTPLWASPEQVLGLPITTASDIYQLGLLLYHLVCRTPAHALRDTSWSELQQVICERPPTRPSTAGRATGEVIRPELEAIILHALEKDPEQRYGSAEDLARDLESFLRHEPVRARPQTWAYRTRKFVQRHTLGVGLAAALVLLLAGGLIVVTRQSYRIAAERDLANLERQRATEIGDFLGSLFDDADPYGSGESLSARALIARGRARIDQELADQPELLVDLQVRLAWASLSLGDADQAFDLAKRVLAHTQPLGRSAAERAEALAILGRVASERGQRALADAALRASIAAAESPAGAAPTTALEARRSLAIDLAARNDPTAARTLLRDVVRVRRGLEDPLRLAADLRGLASVEIDLGDLAAAEAALREAQAISEQIYGAEDPRTIAGLNNLAFVLEEGGQYQAAEDLLRRVIAAKATFLRPQHPSATTSLHNLARVLYRKGQLDEANLLARQATAAWAAELGETHPQTLLARFNLGLIVRELRQLEAARALFREVFDALGSEVSADHPRRRSAQVLWALTELDLGNVDRARGLAGNLDSAATSRGSHLLLTGRLALARGDYGAAETAFRQHLAGESPTGELRSLEAELWLALTLERDGRPYPVPQLRKLRSRLLESTPRLAALADQVAHGGSVTADDG